MVVSLDAQPDKAIEERGLPDERYVRKALVRKDKYREIDFWGNALRETSETAGTADERIGDYDRVFVRNERD